MTGSEASGRIPEPIGRLCDEVAGLRDPMQIAYTLYAGLEPLVQLTVLAVFLFDSKFHKLRRHAVEKGRAVPLREIDIMDLESYSARSARTRAEILVEAEEGARAGARIPGTETVRSLWFGPMLQERELMGVLSVQSAKLGVYGDREKAMFRALAECAGRALASARTCAGQ